MPSVFISPTFKGDKSEGGIKRVIEALCRYLPEFGWRVVDSPAEADLINSHATEIVTGYEQIPVVQSNHGLMWQEYFGEAWDGVNERLVEAIKRADAVTVPSHWVANAIARGIAIEPVVIHHGVDTDAWQPSKAHDGYALWNKARTDAVSDHREVEKLAALMPDVNFVSTIGKASANLKICGVVLQARMRKIVQRAGIYLALPRETFGIGTLEAMACGVPVAGWDYGGQHEIIRNGETGYLAPLGDWDALAAAIRRCIAERERLGANARADALARWGWRDKICDYAALFDSVVRSRHGCKVSVVLTCYNLARYLTEALQSVRAQTMGDWECLIVDDCSDDETEPIAREWMKGDVRFRYIRTPRNLGLPAARNYGIAQAHGRYVIPLDADDLLLPNALALLSDALDKDRGLHIAFGHLDLMSHDGQERRRSPWGAAPYDWRGQLSHQNQLHYSAMLRRSVFERTQGYRRRSWQAEDAEFWCYATTYGLRVERVTDESTLIYRMRSDSKTHQNNAMGTQWSDGDWTAWYPYARKELEGATPFGAQGRPQSRRFWSVSHRAEPQVSVIIPVGPAHRELMQDALDSVLAQIFTDWECIVVNDSGAPLDKRGYAFVKWLETGGLKGTGCARNLGVAQARASLILFLDADDFLQPTFLAETVPLAEKYPNHLIYTDWWMEQGNGQPKIWESRDFDCPMIFQQMIYNISVLLPHAAHQAVGGFDEMMFAWEDWDYFIKLAIHGVGAVHFAKPLMTYRYHTGGRRDEGYAHKQDLLPLIKERYEEYIMGQRG